MFGLRNLENMFPYILKVTLNYTRRMGFNVKKTNYIENSVKNMLKECYSFFSPEPSEDISA